MDGVDSVFIGPSDLSASMGYLGQPGHPEVQAAIAQALRDITALGKAPGTARRLARGGSVRTRKTRAKFLGIGSDTALLLKRVAGIAFVSCRLRGSPGKRTRISSSASVSECPAFSR